MHSSWPLENAAAVEYLLYLSLGDSTGRSHIDVLGEARVVGNTFHLLLGADCMNSYRVGQFWLRTKHFVLACPVSLGVSELELKALILELEFMKLLNLRQLMEVDCLDLRNGLVIDYPCLLLLQYLLENVNILIIILIPRTKSSCRLFFIWLFIKRVFKHREALLLPSFALGEQHLSPLWPCNRGGAWLWQWAVWALHFQNHLSVRMIGFHLMLSKVMLLHFLRRVEVLTSGKDLRDGDLGRLVRHKAWCLQDLWLAEVVIIVYMFFRLLRWLFDNEHLVTRIVLRKSLLF